MPLCNNIFLSSYNFLQLFPTKVTYSDPGFLIRIRTGSVFIELLDLNLHTSDNVMANFGLRKILVHGTLNLEKSVTIFEIVYF